ncbi:MAG: GntR family transcriptional regulator [Anaerolineales bacterium]|nr:GntR family transcriptional regulator [Anaerolineales bacterium]
MNIIVNKQSAVPYYHQVKEAVRALIASGELKPGDMLSSEFSLSEQVGISRLVVHRAYRELVTEGLLIRKRAVGTFVSPATKRSYTVVGPLFSMTESLSTDALEPSNKILLQEVIPASEEVRNGLKLPEGARVIHLRNLRFAKQLPFAVEEMYFSFERFPALANLDLNNRSVYVTLEKLYDAHPQEALDLITADSASSQEARLLGINKGAPVMRVKRMSSDRSGLPVEYSKIVFHADRYQFVARMQRTG